MEERESAQNLVGGKIMTAEERLEYLEQRLKYFESEERALAQRSRHRAIELVMQSAEMVGNVSHMNDVISRAEAISNFILNGNGSYVKFNEATEEGHMAANYVQAMNWLDEQGISRADESGEYSIIHRIKLLLATANKAASDPNSESCESPFINVPVNGVYYNVYGRQTSLIEKDILATDLCDAVKKFRLENPMATIEYIDDREVIALDEETMHPIFEGDEYTIDPEFGSYTLVKSAPWPAGKQD